MLHILVSLAAGLIGLDGAGRGRRRRFHRPGHAHEELGKWIWVLRQAQAEQPDRNSYVYFRKLIDLSSKPTSGVVRATAESMYRLYVNGRYVGQGPARPGSSCSYFDTHDIAELLNKGKNVVAFAVHSFGEETYRGAPRKPGLNCRIEVEAGEERATIGADETWKAIRAPDWTDQGERINASLGFQEVHDARARVERWNEVNLDEQHWENAAVTGSPPQPPWGRLVPRPVPQPREEQVLPKAVVGDFNCPASDRETPPAAVAGLMASSALSPLRSGGIKNPNALTSRDGLTHVRTPRGDAGVAVILDFGREVFGNVEIDIAGSGGGCIDLGYAETLSDGRVKPDRDGTKYTDRILLKGGRLEWQGFEPRAFRYLQMEFRRCTRPVAVQHVRVSQAGYPVAETGSFECSDSLLNRIWETAAHTTRLCMEDVFVNTPARERRLSWPEARVASRAAYYAFGDTTLLAHCLRRFGESTSPPAPLLGGEGSASPEVSLLWVLSILDYYAFSDDIELVRELYPRARRLMGWFARFAGPDALLSDVPGQPPPRDAGASERSEVTALNCLYYHALRVTGALASILGYRNDAERYEQTWRPLRPAINKHLYCPKRGLYADCRVYGKLVEEFSPQTNVLAAVFDVSDQYQRSTICRQIFEKTLPEIATPYVGSYLLEALYAGEFHWEALDFLRGKWGGMIEAGATAFWESFTGEGALCHAASASPARDLIAEYVGIKPVLGSHRFSVSPHAGGLDWARGSIGTKFGPLSVEWRTGRRQLVIDLDVPQGLKVDVYPPGPPDSRVAVDGKPHPGRFVTVDGGPHQIKVSEPPPSRRPRIDESLQPEPAPHVEILQEIYPRRRRPRVGAERELSRRARRPQRLEAETTAEPVTVKPEAPAAERKRPSRRGRPRRGDEAPSEPRVAEAPTEPGPVEPETPAAERRRPSRRGRRGGRAHRPRGEAEQRAAGEQPAPQSEPETVAEVPKPTAPRSRRRARRKRPDHGETAI